MRRHVAHITAATLSFAIGFLAAGTPGSFFNALTAALVAFTLFSVLLRKLHGSRIDTHWLKVAAITLMLWAAMFYTVFGILLLPAGSCVPDFTEEDFAGCAISYQRRVPEDTTITLKRMGGYAQGPNYTLAIFADGTVFFYSDTRPGSKRLKSVARGWISQEQLRRLIEEFERADYFSLRDRYESVSDGCPTVWIDSPSVITSIQLDGREKMIRHYHGCTTRGREWDVFPQQLTELERHIDETAGSSQWLE